MKARVKATGEIKNVVRGTDYPYQYVDNGTVYTEDEVEELPGDDGAIFFDPTIDYWTRLEHQYAGMAMQGLLNNNLLSSVLFKTGTTHVDYINEVVKVAEEYAHTLVQKLKEKEERK